MGTIVLDLVDPKLTYEHRPVIIVAGFAKQSWFEFNYWHEAKKFVVEYCSHQYLHHWTRDFHHQQAWTLHHWTRDFHHQQAWTEEHCNQIIYVEKEFQLNKHQIGIIKVATKGGNCYKMTIPPWPALAQRTIFQSTHHFHEDQVLLLSGPLANWDSGARQQCSLEKELLPLPLPQLHWKPRHSVPRVIFDSSSNEQFRTSTE
jgi:hypothetical protein